MFSSKGVSESGSRYIGYGITDVKVTGIDVKESDGSSTPMMYINFQEVTGEKTVSIRLAFSEKAQPYSMRKIKHLTTKVATEAELDAIEESTLTNYGAALLKLIGNKPVRVKFSGEEVIGTNGKKNFIKTVVNFPPFAEAIGGTTLTFDSKTDIKYLAPTNSAPTTGAKKTADLPF